MEHAKKIILVPEENAKRFQQLLNLPPTVQTKGTALSRLDREMSEISNSNAYRDEREKWASYQNVLEQYLRRKIPDPVRKEGDDQTTVEQAEQKEKQTRYETVLRGVAKTFRSRGKELLEFIDKSSNIEWTKEGRVVIDKVELPNSSISALVNCATSTRSKKTRLPNGMAQFSSALQRASVPEKLIGNSGFWNAQQSPSKTASLNASSSSESPVESPVRSTFGNLTKWTQWRSSV